MKKRPRTKASKKRIMRVKEARRLKKKHPHYAHMGGRFVG